jgi:TonB family protein
VHKLKSLSVGLLVFLFLAVASVSQVFAQNEQKTAISKDTLKKSNSRTEVFTIVEEMPLFNGKPAEKGFRDYVNLNTQYPKEAKSDGIIGDVLVRFTIDVDGSLVDAKVVGSIHPLLDAEALRVVQSSPKWTPGTLKKKPVEVKYTFPVRFRL